jgi:hypothetical protein
MARFARLRPLATFEHWKKQTATCSTPSAAPEHARARPAPCPRPPEPLPPSTGQPSHFQPRPALGEDCARLREASRARNRALLHRRGQPKVTGVQPTAGNRGPRYTVNLSSIPCTVRLLRPPRSSLCPWIELCRRG